MAVGVAQGGRHLAGNPHGFLDGQLLLAPQPVPQRFTVYEWHHIVEEPLCLAGVVQREDMGMGEARRDFDLAEEALGPEGGRQLGTEHLDRDGAAVLQVLGQIDRRRAAVAQLPVQRVTIGQSAAGARPRRAAGPVGREASARTRRDWASASSERRARDKVEARRALLTEEKGSRVTAACTPRMASSIRLVATKYHPWNRCASG